MKLRKSNFQKDAPRVIQGDDFLKLVYSKVYESFFEVAGKNDALEVLELGAGGFTLSGIFWKDVITSDIEQIHDQKDLLKIDSSELPFPENSFDLVVAKDALHHFKDPISSLAEIFRVLRPDGMFVVSEPYWSPLGRLVFRLFHPESWDTKAKSHIIDSRDPWDGNQALLLLLQGRWNSLLAEVHPDLNVRMCKPTYGLSYLLSGGVHSRTRISSRLLIRINEWENKSKIFQRLFGLNIIAVFQLARV